MPTGGETSFEAGRAHARRLPTERWRRRGHARTLAPLAIAGLALACGSLDVPTTSRGGAASPAAGPTPGILGPLPKVPHASWGWLSPDPYNPRYLRIADEMGSRPFSITSYGTLTPCSFSGHEAAHLKRQGATYAVIWHAWSGCLVQSPSWFESPWRGPWALACDPRDPQQGAECPDRPLWELGRFDEVYWRQLENVVAAADDSGDGTGRRLMLRIHLFARQEFDAGGPNNPLRGGNNVNGVRSYDGDPRSDPSVRYFVRAAYLCAQGCGEPARSLFALQQAYVRQVLDVTARYGNVVYELMNEPPAADDADSERAPAFAYFTEYWAWFVKDHLARRYGVSRLVSQHENGQPQAVANVDIFDARWGDHSPGIRDAQFLNGVLPELTSSIRDSYLTNRKVTALDEFGNAAVSPARLRQAVWAIVASGGHFHIEDACNPEFRTCTNPPDVRRAPLDPRLNAEPWVPVRSLEAFKAASGWRFERARPTYRDARVSTRWFYWMLQGDPAFDAVAFAGGGGEDHVGYLAHRPAEACTVEPLESELPAAPGPSHEYVARLWDPAGTDYLRDAGGRILEQRFAWPGGLFDWCRTGFRDVILRSDDLVFHVRAEPSLAGSGSGSGSASGSGVRP